MSSSESLAHESYPDQHHDLYAKTLFGFWVYLLTDFVLFVTFFATYVVLDYHRYGSLSALGLFHLPFTLTQTLLFLVSSVTVGLGSVEAHRQNKTGTLFYFALTFVLGFIFLAMVGIDFSHFFHAGYNWKTNALLSAYFALIGLHSVHLILALLWILVLLLPVCRFGVEPVSIKRLSCLKMFWQFLNIIWIFTFTIIYLMGVN